MKKVFKIIGIILMILSAIGFGLFIIAAFKIGGALTAAKVVAYILYPIPTILIFLLGYKMFKSNKKKGR